MADETVRFVMPVERQESIHAAADEGIGDITAVKRDDVGGKVWSRQQIEELLNNKAV